MLTTRFKATIATLGALAVVGGVTYNQATLQHEVTTLENKPAQVRTVVVLPSISPTATPAATLTPVRYFVPTRKATVPTK